MVFLGKVIKKYNDGDKNILHIRDNKFIYRGKLLALISENLPRRWCLYDEDCAPQDAV